jgi:hypothetical protein
MTKRRNFMTFEETLDRMIHELGIEHAANAVDRSPWTLRKWADPDHDSLPNLMNAVQLDEAYTRAGLTGATLFQTYAALCKHELASHAIDPKDATLGVQSAIGALSSEIAQATHALGESGTDITDAERKAILRETQRSKELLQRVELAVEQAAMPATQ